MSTARERSLPLWRWSAFCAWSAVFLLLSFGGGATAQEGGFGALRGSVVDEDFLVGVEGAQVILEGTSSTQTSDENGNFFINNVKPGIYSLMVSRAGYIRTRREGVVVSAGSVREVQLGMIAEVVELDEFVVTGEDLLESTDALEPVAIAQDLDSFASALGSDFLSKAGGGDIGSAVKNLSGTSVADSRYVVIRGLSDRYNVVVLNAARLPSSDPDKRAVNIDLFPSNLVENIISSKTFTPDLPGEATGGYLNIVTKSFPKEPFVKISFGEGYNTAATGNPNFVTYNGAGTGFLGTSRERALPAFLQGTTIQDLPGTPPTQVTAGGLNPPAVGQLRQQAAQALAGTTMGVTTKAPPPDFSFGISAGTTLEDFMGGRLGLLMAATYSKGYKFRTGQRGRSELVTLVPTPQYQLNRLFDYQEGEESMQAGLLVSAGWQGPRDDEISLTYFTNTSAEDVAQFALGEYIFTSDPNDNLPPLQSGTVGIRETIAYTERKLSTLQLRGEHRFPEHGDIKIDWTAAYSWTYQDQPDLRTSSYLYDVPNQRFQGVTTDITSGLPFERVWRRLDDTNFNLNFNIELPFYGKEGDDDYAKFKFGGAFDHSDREYRAENFGYSLDINPIGNPYQVPPLGTIGPGDDSGLTLADQLTGADLVPSDRFSPFFALDSTFLRRPEFPQATERYFAEQNIGAAYGMTTFTIGGGLELIAGARLESTDMRVQNIVDVANLTGDATAIFAALGVPNDRLANPSIEAVDLLPVISAKWDVSDQFTIRGAITRTIARPTFKEITPVFNRDPASGDFFVGNPTLERSDIWNYDLRAEWFPKPSDFVILSFFTKDISRPIEALNLGEFDSVFNEQSAVIYGFEFEVSKQLEGWGPILDDLRIGFNFAKMFSKVQLNDITKSQRVNAGLSGDRPLQGQPDYTMNFNAIYDSSEWGLSVGAFLNVTGEMLYQVGGVNASTVGADVVQEAFTTLDFSISKVLYDDWKLNFRVANVLNSERRRVDRVGNRVVGVFESRFEGTNYSIGISRDW